MGPTTSEPLFEVTIYIYILYEEMMKKMFVDEHDSFESYELNNIEWNSLLK